MQNETVRTDGSEAGSKDHEESELSESPGGEGPSDQKAKYDVAFLERSIAQVLVRMEASIPEMIRATPAYRALGVCSVRWGRDLHRLSHQTKRIQQFVSHSWHGSQFAKLLTLHWFYKCYAAALVSSIFAILAAVLFATHVLRGEILLMGIYTYPRSFWGLGVGLLSYCLTMLVWRPRRSIFLDIICINQEDEEEKISGLLSMPAILKSSDSLLVLFDPTLARRLWCIFELAAFLHSRPEGEKPRVIIRPTVLGPCLVLQTLALACVLVGISAAPDQNQEILWLVQGLMCFFGFYFNVAAIRAYFRSVESMQSQLASFKLEDAMCGCCARGHADPDGAEIMCDRRITVKCITSWFGSTAAFEAKVQKEVLGVLVQQLSSDVFTFRQCVTTLMPLLWAHMDAAASPIFGYGWVQWAQDAALSEVFRGLAWWLGAAPVVYLATVRLAEVLRSRRSRKVCDVLVNLFILACLTATFLCFSQVEQGCYQVAKLLFSRWQMLNGMIIFACVTIPFAALVCLCIRRRA